MPKLRKSGKAIPKTDVLTMLLLLFQIVFTLVISNKYICDATVFSILFSGISVFLIMSGKDKPEINTKQKIYAVLFSVLYLFMLSIFDIINFTVFPFSQKSAVRTVLIFALSLAIILGFYTFTIYLFGFFMKEKKPLKPSEESANLKLYYRIIIAVSLVFFIVGGFGFSTADAQTIYYIASHNIWNEWHTLPYELLVKIGLMLFSKDFYLFPVILFHFVGWCFISFYAINSLYDEFKNTKVLKIYTAASCLIFTPFFFIMIAFKDTVFSMFLYSFAISIFNFIRKDQLTKKEWICLALNATLASLFRHAAIEVVAVSLILILLIRFIKDKSKKDILKYVCIILTPIIIYTGIVTGIGQGVLHATKNPEYVKYTVPLYLSAAVAEKTGDNFEKENVEVLEEIMPLEEWKEAYNENTYWADTVSRTWGGIGKRVYNIGNEYGKKILKMNASMLVHHPKEYLESFMEISSVIWRISNPKNCIVFNHEWKIFSNTDSYRKSVAGDIVGEFADYTMKNPLTDAVLWRGGIWILFALFSSYVLAKKRRKDMMLIILPVVIFAATLFVSIPAQDPRYILSFIEVETFYGVVAFSYQNKKQTNT